MPRNLKHLDGTRSHLARLMTRLTCSERLRSQVIHTMQEGSVWAKMFQSSRHWRRERPCDLANVPSALTR